jgi:transposase-like protein
MIRPGRECLEGTVEVDEALFGGLEEGASGRGTNKKALVAVAVEVTGSKIGRIRMRVIPSASAENLNSFILDNVYMGSTIITDGWTGYSKLASLGYTHTVKLMKDDSAALPHVHRVISLAKRWLSGTCQGALSPTHLSFYLDEFTFRFNRRTSKNRGKLFFRLIEQAIQTPPLTWKEMSETARRKRRQNVAAQKKEISWQKSFQSVDNIYTQ